MMVAGVRGKHLPDQAVSMGLLGEKAGSLGLDLLSRGDKWQSFSLSQGQNYNAKKGAEQREQRTRGRDTACARISEQPQLARRKPAVQCWEH